MAHKIFFPKCFIVVFFVLMASLYAPSVHAALIDSIDISPTGGSYNSGTGDFIVSGNPATGIKAFYNDGRIPNPEITISPFLNFTLSTIGLDSTLSNGGNTITYSSSGTFGALSITDDIGGTDILLAASLVDLEMEIVNPGAFSGSGTFDVFGGSLADDFGANGGLVTIGLSFTVPVDFNTSFVSFVNAQLFPTSTVATQVPEPSTSILFGIALLGLGVVSRRKLIAHSLMGTQNH